MRKMNLLQVLKVRAHSTRAIGTSWALFKGTSVHEISESADWSLESTFSRFYLRELDVKVLQKLLQKLN